MARAPSQDVSVEVVIARNVAAARAQKKRPLIAVIPDYNDWNDYGFRSFANLLILPEKGAANEDMLPFRLMVKDQERLSTYLDALISAHGAVVPISRIGTSFCSLQNESKTYEHIVEVLGFDAAIAALRKLHDIVLAELEGEDAETIALARTSDFHLGMIRISQRFTAYRRGGRYLRPTAIPKVEDAAADFSVTTELPSYDDAIKVDFDFTPHSIFEDRCCVLIGRNGAGKTQLLNRLVAKLAEAGAAADGQANGLERPPAVSRAIIFSSVPSDPYPKSVPPWAGLDYEYVAMAADSTPLGGAFMRGVLDCFRVDDSGFGEETSREGRFDLLAELLGLLGFWDRLYLPVHKGTEDLFRDVVSLKTGPYVSIAGRFSERAENDLAAWIDRDRPAIILSDMMEPRRLSSGELAMAQFVAQAVASIENGSLLLFDEPETHLHPNYISTFMDILQELLARTRSIAIIATHSAYVLREVPRNRVNVIVREGETPLVLRPRLQTFGANIDELSQFVFQDDHVSPRFRRRLAEWGLAVAADGGIEGIVSEYAAELSPATLAIIAEALRKEGAA